MDIEHIIATLVIFMVLGVIMISIVIPTTQAGIAVSQYAGTVSNEAFTGVNNTPSTLARYVAEVISFEKGSIANVINSTALTGANSSKLVSLSRPYTGANRTITINSTGNLTLNNVSFSFNGGAVNRLSSTTESWTGAGTDLINGVNTIAFTNNGTAISVNITSVRINYTSFADSTAYTLNDDGTLTPTGGNATYRAGYYYASTGTNNAVVLLNIIPVLLAIMLILILIGLWKLM